MPGFTHTIFKTNSGDQAVERPNTGEADETYASIEAHEESHQRRETMTFPIQLVFDTNILVDLLLAHGPDCKYAAQLVEKVVRREVEGWYAPHSLTTV